MSFYEFLRRELSSLQESVAAEHRQRLSELESDLLTNVNQNKEWKGSRETTVASFHGAESGETSSRVQSFSSRVAQEVEGFAMVTAVPAPVPARPRQMSLTVVPPAGSPMELPIAGAGSPTRRQSATPSSSSRRLTKSSTDPRMIVEDLHVPAAGEELVNLSRISECHPMGPTESDNNHRTSVLKTCHSPPPDFSEKLERSSSEPLAPIVPRTGGSILGGGINPRRESQLQVPANATKTTSKRQRSPSLLDSGQRGSLNCTVASRRDSTSSSYFVVTQAEDSEMNANDDNFMGHSGSFRPSRQRLSLIQQEMQNRASMMSVSPRPSNLGMGPSMSAKNSIISQVPEQKVFEVSRAWTLGAFGTTFRRKSSRGMGSKMSLFMDHFLPEEEENIESEAEKSKQDRAHGIVRRCQKKFMMQPNHPFHLSWQLVGLSFIVYDGVMVPMTAFDVPGSTVLDAIDWVMRLFWTIHIVVTFSTGHLTSDGVVEMRPTRVARQYIFTWFPLDVSLSTFDWTEYIIGRNGGEAGVAVDGHDKAGASSLPMIMRSLRMLKSMRLIRLLKAPEMTQKITDLIPFHEWLGLMASLLKLMLLFLFFAHVVACTWFGIGNYMCRQGQCWVEVAYLSKAPWWKQYSISLHWSLLALSGDTGMISPENQVERMSAMLVLYLAFVVSAVYVGSITTTMTNIQMMASEQSSKMAVLRRFLLDHGISRVLALRVQRNAQHTVLEQKSKAVESSVELLTFISQPLLIEVHYEIYSPPLIVHPFFACYIKVNPAGIRKVCHTAITMLSLHNKDILFSDLEVAEKPQTYFVVSGKLQYMHDMRVVTLGENSWLCEHALWTFWTHAGTARSTTETRLLCLDAEKWQEIVCTFPTEHACIYAAQFVHWLNADSERSRSDLGPEHHDMLDMLIQTFPETDEDEESHESSSDGEGGGTSRRPSILSRLSENIGVASMRSAASWNMSHRHSASDAKQQPSDARHSGISATRPSLRRGVSLCAKDGKDSVFKNMFQRIFRRWKKTEAGPSDAAVSKSVAEEIRRQSRRKNLSIASNTTDTFTRRESAFLVRRFMSIRGCCRALFKMASGRDSVVPVPTPIVAVEFTVADSSASRLSSSPAANPALLTPHTDPAAAANEDGIDNVTLSR